MLHEEKNHDCTLNRTGSQNSARDDREDARDGQPPHAGGEGIKGLHLCVLSFIQENLSGKFDVVSLKISIYG